MRVPWSQQEWRRALVYGLGVSGTAAVRFLRAREVSVVVVDDRALEDLDSSSFDSDADVEVHSSAELVTLPADLDGVVTSPGVPPTRPLLAQARALGLPVIAEIELAFPFVRAPIVAITGSNGKSTTAALAGAMIGASGRQAVVCGNFGRPLVDCIDEPADVFVTEVSSFQLESTDTFRPRAAALLNLSADHLDRHGTLAAYAAAKATVFENQHETDIAVFNADDPLVRAIAEKGVRSRRRYFSRTTPVDDGCYVDDGAVFEVEPGLPRRRLFESADVPVPGTHNLENAMASALIARAVGVEEPALAAGLAAFVGLPHRVERVLDQAGVLWFDDSKGTNIGATVKSLEGFSDRSVHLILGGRGKGGDIAELVEPVRRKVRRLYLIGESAADFEQGLGGVVEAELVGDLATAVTAAATRARAGEVVLLSPACASFDQYDNYMARGDHFKRLVQELSEAARG